MNAKTEIRERDVRAELAGPGMVHEVQGAGARHELGGDGLGR